MKKDIRYNQVNPLVRVKESELLTKEQWATIGKASSLETLRQILSATVYAPYVKEEDFADRFEEALKKRRSDFFNWAYTVAPEKELVDIYTLRYTFHNLKALTKGELLQQNLDHLYVDDGRFTKDVLKSAIRTQASSVLPTYVMKGIKEVISYFNESNILQGIDIIYDRIYLTTLKQLAQTLKYQELIDEVEAFIDLTNISITARGMLQKQTKGFLTTVLSSAGSIEKDSFLTFVGQSLKEFTVFLLRTNYRALLEPIVTKDTLQIQKLAFLKDNYLTTFYMRSKTVAFGPLPLLALLNAKEIEEKNLRLFITGLRNGFSKEVLQERMRDVDGL